ncbi:hypothetical protein PR003_g27487 [Phytophthora rubi]|uniref:Reverse transcriptase n=1 Tax=Phytophthora rubi TaxID=129364 RepID=A0A6A4BZ50_9STRA|nr:hypothetical protein PR003_g27487 [Phytophthora rubi]
MWFMSLDMASGFWAIRMTERAKLISAFVCPFGHFQWVRMPFGLKNAPLIYQHVINNCLWGVVRLPPEEEALVDQEVLDYLGLDPQDSGKPGRAELDPDVTPPENYLPVLTEQMTVFKRNIPMPSRMGPVLGRSSYIDDIAHGAATWDQLCDDLDALLYRLRYWNILVSLPKSEFGKRTIPYLSHEIGAEGIRATPKIVKGIQDLPFPKTLKGVHSFLGSLNYYHKFIEDFPVVAAVLYELTDDQVRAGRDLLRAKEAFAILKQKIVSTPMLRHPDRSKPIIIIPHANQWAACAVLGQEHDGVIQPVRFTGRVLHDGELRYHIAEKEVLAVIRVLQTFKTLVEGCPLIVYTRYSVLKWVIKSKTADGRTVPWGVALSHYDLDIRKVQRDEDGLAAILGAGITPREHLDEVAENLIPAKGRIRAPPVLCVEMLAADYSGVVLSFDGAAKTSTKQGSCGCILWQLPEWTILDARGFILNGVTVNDAEYYGLLKGLGMALEHNIQDLVAVGDSRIVIQQVQGLINCNQPNLKRRLAECQVLKEKFKLVRLVHVKRDFNQAADYLTSKTLVSGEDWVVQDEEEKEHLRVVSKIPEQIMKSPEENAEVHSVEPVGTPDGSPSKDPGRESGPGPESAPLPFTERVLAVLTRGQTRDTLDDTPPLGPLEFQAERWRRIRAHQERDEYLSEIRDFLRGDLERFSPKRLRQIAKVADLFALDVRGVLYRLARSTRDRPRDAEDQLCLVVPEALREDMLHYTHEDVQGGHQGITRTYEKLRSEFYWPGMYAGVEHYVKECTDCASGKGCSPNPGPSPGNIEPRRPF